MSTTRITPSWIAVAIRGYDGQSTEPTEAFISAAADRVWNHLIDHGTHSFAPVRSADSPLGAKS